jgi:hypothetical protein
MLALELCWAGCMSRADRIATNATIVCFRPHSSSSSSPSSSPSVLANRGRTPTLIDTRARHVPAHHGYLRHGLLIGIQLHDFQDDGAGVAEVVFHGDAIAGSEAAVIEGKRAARVVAEVWVVTLAHRACFKATTLHRAKRRKVVQAQAAIKQCL